MRGQQQQQQSDGAAMGVEEARPVRVRVRARMHSWY